MRQFVLAVDPSVWNVIKFFALALVITPIFEILLQSLICSRVTLAVRTGKEMQMFDSRLGIIALHSKYAGSRRNRFGLVFCAVFILSVQLLLEYSFNATEIEQFESVSVSEGPDHHTRYYGANQAAIHDEPTRFLEDVARSCISDLPSFNRSQPKRPMGPIVDQFSYNTTFKIRAPYMRADDSALACGASKKERDVYVMIPNISEPEVGYVGFLAHCFGAYDSHRSWFDKLLDAKLRVTGSFDLEGVPAQVFTGEHIVCIKEVSSGITQALCVISNGTEIAVAKASLSEEHRVLQCIVMFISGEGMQQLHEPARKVRFLAYLTEEKVYDPNWSNAIGKWIPRSTLEQTALVAVVVANEEGVVGVEGSFSSRSIILPGKRNVTTVSFLALIPVTMLLVTALILALSDVFARNKIAKIEGKEKGLKCGPFSHSRVNMTLDWVRERVAADLTRSGLRTYASDDVRVRLVGHGEHSRLQVLPEGIENKMFTRGEYKR